MSQIASILLVLSLGMAMAVPANGELGADVIWAPVAPSTAVQAETSR